MAIGRHFVKLSRVNKLGDSVVYTAYVLTSDIIMAEDIAGVPQSHGATIANARVVLRVNRRGKNSDQDTTWEVTQTAAQIVGAFPYINPPLTGDGQDPATPLDIDFTTLDAADVTAICQALTNDPTCIESFYDAMLADPNTKAKMDAYWDTRMQARFSFTGGNLLIDLNADGNAPAC